MDLTPGAIEAVLAQQNPGNLRLQCLGTKCIQSHPQGERFRVILSDGVVATSFILASQLNHLAKDNTLRENCIVNVEEHIANMVDEAAKKLVIIIIKLSIIAHDVPKIGNPVMFTTYAPGSAHYGRVNNAQPPPPQQQQPGSVAHSSTKPPQVGGAYGAPPPQQYHHQQPQQGGNMYGAPPQQQGLLPAAAAGGGGAYGGPPMPGAGPYGAPPPHLMNNPNGGPPPAGPYGGHPPANPYGAPAPGTGMGGGAPDGGPPRPHVPPNPYGGGGGGYNAPMNNGGGGGAPPPNYRAANGGATVRNEAPAHILDIDSLNPYQNRWTIKARVTHKSDIRKYTNARGEGKFFSFDLLDAKGGEIRVVGWNDQCDRYFDQVEQGVVYLLSKASLRNKRGNFNQTRHQYEIHLETGSQLEPVQDEGAIPQISYNFVPIAAIEDFPQGHVADVIGIVESVSDWATIRKRDGMDTQKRSVVIRDASNKSIELTLWGNYVNEPGQRLQQAVQSGYHPVLAVKAARVGDFNGKNLSTVASSNVAVDPVDTQEAAQLRSWYDSVGAHQQAQALSMVRGAGGAGGGKQDRRICLSQITAEGLGLGQPAWVQVLGHVAYIRTENFCYPACPMINELTNKTCNKKMVPADQDGTGQYFCERCNKTALPDHRYIVSMQVADHTDQHWCTAFNEAAPEVIGMQAGQLKELQDAGDPKFESSVTAANFGMFLMKFKIHEDTYNDETKLRFTMVKAEAPDFVRESAWMIDAIKKLDLGQDPYAPLAAAGAGGAAGGGPQQQGYGGQQQYQQPGVGGGYGAAPMQQQAGGGYNAHPPQQYQQGGGWGGPAAAAGGGGAYGGAPQQAQQQWGPPGGGYGGGAGYQQGGYR